MKRRHEIAGLLFWAGISLFALFSSYGLGLGDFQDPGPGLMPFLAGATLLAVCTVLVLNWILQSRSTKHEEPVEHRERTHWKKVSAVSASLLGWAFVVEGLGYLLASLFLFTFLFRITGITQWRYVVAAAVLTTAGSFLFFMLLGVRFPLGVFRGI